MTRVYRKFWRTQTTAKNKTVTGWTWLDTLEVGNLKRMRKEHCYVSPAVRLMAVIKFLWLELIDSKQTTLIICQRRFNPWRPKGLSTFYFTLWLKLFQHPSICLFTVPIKGLICNLGISIHNQRYSASGCCVRWIFKLQLRCINDKSKRRKKPSVHWLPSAYCTESLVLSPL